MSTHSIMVLPRSGYDEFTPLRQQQQDSWNSGRYMLRLLGLASLVILTASILALRHKSALAPSPAAVSTSPSSTPMAPSSTPSAFTELVWEECSTSSDYDYQATLIFCQDGDDGYDRFGYIAKDGGKNACNTSLAPLIRMQAGKSYQLRLENQGTEPTNLHTHGLHIPGSGNADDVSRRVNPGNCLLYNYTIPEFHMAGTFWYHAHLYGSTKRQVQGGAYGMLIVDSSDTENRPAFLDREHLLLIAHNQDRGTLLVNGQPHESVTFVAGQWQYLRLAMVDVDAMPREIHFDDTRCKVQSVAYDGVFRSTVPNPTDAFTYRITGATRIDLAVKCTNSSGLFYNETDFATATPLVEFIVVDATGVKEDEAIEPWVPNRPNYLTDLRQLHIPMDTFRINLVYNTINAASYSPDVPIGTFEYGQVQQWTITNADWHPFHLHMFHMQVRFHRITRLVFLRAFSESSRLLLRAGVATFTKRENGTTLFLAM